MSDAADPAAALVASADRPLDVLAIGELLVDLIAEQADLPLAEARSFARFQGGSAANLAANVARLGGRSALAAAVGEDGLGAFARRRIAAVGVDVRHVVARAEAATTTVVLSRTAGSPEFVAHRGADASLALEDVPPALTGRCRIVHTSCFALSRQPTRDTVLRRLEQAVAAGAVASLELNYAPPIWPRRQEAVGVVRAVCARGALVKASADDVARLLGSSAATAPALARLHAWGAPLVALTLGDAGSVVSWDGGRRTHRVPARPVRVVDATGAGDAYWAAFLAGLLAGLAPPRCAAAGARLAELALRRAGPLPNRVDRDAVLNA